MSFIKIKSHPCPYCQEPITLDTVMDKGKKKFIGEEIESIKICPHCQNEVIVERTVGNMLKTILVIIPVLIIWLVMKSYLTSILSAIFTACCIFCVIVVVQYFDGKNKFIKNRMK